MVDNREITIMVFKLLLINIIINNGASFCQVKIKNKINQVICLVKLGSQKCIGAPPSFKINDKISKIDKFLLNIECHESL